MKDLHTYLDGYPALHLHGPTLCVELHDLCGSLGIPATPPNCLVILRRLMDALDDLAGDVEIEAGPHMAEELEGF